MSFITPPVLHAGDTVAVVATARAVQREAVEHAMAVLRSWGLDVHAGDALFGHHHLFAGTDQQRLKDLQKALDSPEIKAVFCARGGYGTTRIINQIDWSGFKKNPKWICGFSDITSLLCKLHGMGYVSVHSTMPQLYCEETALQDLESLRALVYGGTGSMTAVEHPSNRPGSSQGILVGGNLSLLVNAIGTDSDVDTGGKILFIEEVDEYLYHLDRMMIHLKRAHKLQDLAGLVVGHMTKMKEGDLPLGANTEGIIASQVQEWNFPVAFGMPFGHDKPNIAIPLGKMASLEVGPTGSHLTF